MCHRMLGTLLDLPRQYSLRSSIMASRLTFSGQHHLPIQSARPDWHDRLPAETDVAAQTAQTYP